MTSSEWFIEFEFRVKLNQDPQPLLRRSSSACLRFDEAFALYTSLGHLIGQAKCLRSHGDTAILQKRPDEAVTYFLKALPLFAQPGDESGVASCISGLGEAARLRGDVSLTKRQLKCALRIYESIGFPTFWAQAFVSRILGGMAATEENDFATARLTLERALGLAVQADNQLEVAHCLRDYGKAAILDGDIGRARGVWKHAATLYGLMGVQKEVDACNGLLSTIEHVSVGRFEVPRQCQIAEHELPSQRTHLSIQSSSAMLFAGVFSTDLVTSKTNSLSKSPKSYPDSISRMSYPPPTRAFSRSII